jgi:hypothetical protein
MVAIHSPRIFNDLIQYIKWSKNLDDDEIENLILKMADRGGFSPRELLPGYFDIRKIANSSTWNKAYFNSLVCNITELLTHSTICEAISTSDQAIKIIKENPSTLAILLKNDKIKKLLSGALEKNPNLIAELMNSLPDSPIEKAAAEFFTDIITRSYFDFIDKKAHKTIYQKTALNIFFSEHPSISLDKRNQLLSLVQKPDQAKGKSPVSDTTDLTAVANVNTSIGLLLEWHHKLNQKNKATYEELTKAIEDQIAKAESLRDYIEKIDSTYPNKVNEQLNELAGLTLESVRDTINNDDLKGKIENIKQYHQNAQRIVKNLEKLDPHHKLKNFGKCVAVFACGLIGMVVLAAIAFHALPAILAMAGITVAAGTTKASLFAGVAGGLFGYLDFLSGAAGCKLGHYAFFGKSAPERFLDATLKVIQKTPEQNENADQEVVTNFQPK